MEVLDVKIGRGLFQVLQCYSFRGNRTHHPRFNIRLRSYVVNRKKTFNRKQFRLSSTVTVNGLLHRSGLFSPACRFACCLIVPPVFPCRTVAGLPPAAVRTILHQRISSKQAPCRNSIAGFSAGRCRDQHKMYSVTTGYCLHAGTVQDLNRLPPVRPADFCMHLIAG